MSVIIDNGSLLLLLAALISFFMAWGIGANDVANAMATSVGSKALSLKQAIYIAIIFEFAGAFFAGGEVTETIRKGIVDSDLLTNNPLLLIHGMLASLLAAGTWLLIATFRGWPVSTTHSIVGAIVGFTCVGISSEAVHWSQIGSIAASWVASPLSSGVLAFLIYTSLRQFIFNTEQPIRNAKKYLPLYLFLVGYTVSMVTMLKGLKHLELNLSYLHSAQYALVGGMFMSLLGYLRMQKYANKPVRQFTGDYRLPNGLMTTSEQGSLNHSDYMPNSSASHQSQAHKTLEKTFSLMMLFTACAMAFAHGSNDVANAIGPLASIVGVIESGGVITSNTAIPSWVLLLGAAGIVAGLVTYGHKVIATVGSNITKLSPSSGFAATLAAASTVVVASGSGMPISTTHTLVGAIVGVACAQGGYKAVNLKMVGTIVNSWLLTLPAGALFAIVYFYLFKTWI